MTSPIAGDREAEARELLAQAYEEYEGEGPYPTYAALARTGKGSFTLCSIRAIQRALDRAALLEPVGEGWVMVPKEPTDEMLTRAVYAIACGTAREVALKHYRAMIAASPKSNGGMGS